MSQQGMWRRLPEEVIGDDFFKQLQEWNPDETLAAFNEYSGRLLYIHESAFIGRVKDGIQKDLGLKKIPGGIAESEEFCLTRIFSPLVEDAGLKPTEVTAFAVLRGFGDVFIMTEHALRAIVDDVDNIPEGSLTHDEGGGSGLSAEPTIKITLGRNRGLTLCNE